MNIAVTTVWKTTTTVEVPEGKSATVLAASVNRGDFTALPMGGDELTPATAELTDWNAVVLNG